MFCCLIANPDNVVVELIWFDENGHRVGVHVDVGMDKRYDFENSLLL